MTSYVSPVAFTTVAQSIPPNVFADMDRKVAAAVEDGADVIDLAKGNPDAFPADFIREVAKKAVDDPANARYSPFDGKPSFLQAAEQWYRNTYGVEVDWKTQLFAVEGAVDGLAALFAVLVSPGDAVAYADPYYPSYHCMTVMSTARSRLPAGLGCGACASVESCESAGAQLSEQSDGCAGSAWVSATCHRFGS